MNLTPPPPSQNKNIIIIIIIIMQRLTRHVSVIGMTNRRIIAYRLHPCCTNGRLDFDAVFQLQ